MSAARPGLTLGKQPDLKMERPATPIPLLASQCAEERQRIRKDFDSGTGARDALQALCALADRTVQQVFNSLQAVHNDKTEGLTLLALGGYGRRMLFPYSDLDILLLFADHVGFGISGQLRGPHHR